MNAIHASANALANANPNSQVGRIASYQAAARGTLSGAETVTQHANELLAAQDDLTTAQEELAAAVASGDATAEEIAALQADVTAGEGAVLTAEAGLRDAQQDLGELTEAEAAALLTATGGRVLSPAALAYVRSELNI